MLSEPRKKEILMDANINGKNKPLGSLARPSSSQKLKYDNTQRKFSNVGGAFKALYHYNKAQSMHKRQRAGVLFSAITLVATGMVMVYLWSWLVGGVICALGVACGASLFKMKQPSEPKQLFQLTHNSPHLEVDQKASERSALGQAHLVAAEINQAAKTDTSAAKASMVPESEKARQSGFNTTHTNHTEAYLFSPAAKKTTKGGTQPNLKQTSLKQASGTFEIISEHPLKKASQKSKYI